MRKLDIWRVDKLDFRADVDVEVADHEGDYPLSEGHLLFQDLAPTGVVDEVLQLLHIMLLLQEGVPKFLS